MGKKIESSITGPHTAATQSQMSTVLYNFNKQCYMTEDGETEQSSFQSLC